MTAKTTVCPGCGLELPSDPAASNLGYFNATAECWSVFGEVTAFHYAHPMLAGRAHQTVVDAYAVQHAGGPHPAKSVDIHLAGLYLVLERGERPADVAPLLQRLASRVEDWPDLLPPEAGAGMTILEVALAEPAAHVERVVTWARRVWRTWAPHHAAVVDLVTRGR